MSDPDAIAAAFAVDERVELDRLWQTHLDTFRMLIAREQGMANVGGAPLGLDPSDERADIDRQIQAHIELLRAWSAPEQHLANVKGTLIGLSIAAIAQAIAEGWLDETTTTVADSFNQLLEQRELPWRLVRPN